MLLWFLRSFGLLDNWGITPLAAITLAFPAIMLTQQMAFGALGGAVSSSISRALGANDKNRAEELLWHSLYISFLGALVFFIGFMLFGEGLLRILGGSDALLDESLKILFCLSCWRNSGLAIRKLNGCFKGNGRHEISSALTVICAGIQIILSAGFILGLFGFPKLGLVGSAWSMIITSTFMACVILFKIKSSTSPVRLKINKAVMKKELFADIFSVALPASLSPIFTVGTVLVLTGLIGQFGTTAIAGYGIGSRVEFLLIPIVFSIGTAMTTMVGTNIGANNVTRAEQIGMVGAASSGLLSGLIGLILALTPDLWISFFTSDQEVLSITKIYIQILGVCYLFQGVGLSLYFASQGANSMRWPIVITAIRFIVFTVAALLSVYYFATGVVGIFYSSAGAMTLFGILMFIAVKKGAWR